MASRSGRQEETGDRSRESRREADGHIDDFVSSPVGRRSPTTAAGPPERHRIASASPTPARRQQGGATAPFPGTGRGPPVRGKGSSPGEIGVGFTTAQLEQLGAAIQSAVVPLSDTLTREVTALRARVDYLNARVDTEVASRTPVIRAAPQSVSSEGLSGVSITGFGERPEFPRSSFPSSPPMSRSPGLSAAAGVSVPPPPPAPIHRVATGTAPEVPSTSTPTPAAERAESKSDEKDIFSRADKWLPAMPTPDFKKWSVNRQEEILCFSEYVLQLRSWVALGSDVFALEIEQALRWPTELHTASLSKGAQVRSTRLLAILQQVFASYPRADMLLRAYIEGVGADGVYQIHRGTSGFEALRILGKEFSLRSRAEASFFRAEVLKKSFRGESNATAVSDIVRKLDVELSRYRKLVETLPTSHSRDGLEIQSADLTLILLRSLPAGARDYVMLHASDESFPSLRAAALRYEGQQRLFMELGPGSQARHVHEVAVDPDVYEWYEYQDWDDWEEDEEQLPVSAAMKGGDRCRQCGKAGHFAKNCSTDMSKVRCFKCGDSGHIGANCKKSPSAKGKPSPKTSPKSRANPKSKGKGSGKGGKKGKMHELAEGEVAEEEEGEWQAQEWPEDWADTPEGGVMMPLICSFQETDWSWWLLDSGAAVSVLSENFCHVDVGGAPMDVSGLKVSAVNLDQSQAERKRQHVLKGHFPYDPHCLECQQGRGVSRAPRRPMRERVLEIQVDFFFLGTHKLVLFRQVMTGLLGVTAVSEDIRVTGSHIRQILTEFSLVGGEGPPIDFRTDAAPDVTALIQRSGIPREYTVTRAGPQNHDSVGSVERGVREVKEGIATIRLELAKENCDLQDSLAGWEACARYVVAMHNLHGKVENTGKTGREVLRDSVEASRVSAMFCSHVLAETPESVPSVGRFVSAGYLYPVRNSFSHFVVAKIEDDLKYFQAKSLKFVFPITYPMDLVGRFLRRTGSEPPPGPIEDQSPVEIIPDYFAKLPDSIPPPRHWLDKFGNTDDCTACATRKGKHSVKCYERYRNWLRRGDEKKQEDKKPPVPAPVADEEVRDLVPQEPQEPQELPPVKAKDVAVIPGLPKGMAPTRGCPSCDSGMVAPGIRHSAKCKKSQAQFLEASSMHVEKATSYRDPPKAVEDELANYAAEMDYAPSDLEKDHDVPMDEPEDIEMSGDLLEDSEMVDSMLELDGSFVCSIRFDWDGPGEYQRVNLCGTPVRVWKPSGAVSDTTLVELSPSGTFRAMVKEIEGLTGVRAGNVLTQKEMERFCAEFSTRPIPCRWVTGEKPEADEGVRARMVVKDIARGAATARAQGISGPTPSVESLRVLLGMACGAWGCPPMGLFAIDVSQAFMNAPLEKHHVVVRLPTSVSRDNDANEPVYLEAKKGLNGLRVGSLAWASFFARIVREAGLESSVTEPCLYAGSVGGAPVVLICYVDDVLVATPKEASYKIVFDLLAKHVKIRETGRIPLSSAKNGSLRFLGRTISRKAGDAALYLSVDPDYMDECFREFGIEKGSTTFPDIRPAIEETIEQEPISAEAHARFRRILGRLSWMCQTRLDLLVLVGLLSTGQVSPKPGHEKALRMVLRYLITDMKVGQRFPTEGELPDYAETLLVYTDAGFAPMRSTNRRSITGVCLVYRGVLLKAFSRHQGSVTLSSCEAELSAGQEGIQEGLGLSRTVFQVLKALGLVQVTSLCLAWLTDSLSGKMILEASDLQRRSRHVEIRICWLRELMAKGILECAHVPGTENPADALTKCLALATFLKHRVLLGFVPLRAAAVSSVVDTSFQGFLHTLVFRQCYLCGDHLERGQQHDVGSQHVHNLVVSQHVNALLALRKPLFSVWTFWTSWISWICWISHMFSVMFSFWTCLQELRVCFALFRSCFELCVPSAAVLDHEVAQLAAQVPRYALPEPAAMDGEDDLRSEATTRVDWTTGEPLRKASPAAEPATVPAEPVVAPSNPAEPVLAPVAEVPTVPSAIPATEAPTSPADPDPVHEAPAEPSAPAVLTSEVQPKAPAEAGTAEAGSLCGVSATPSHSKKSSVASKTSRVTRIKLLKSLRRTLFGPNAEVKRAPKRLAKKRKAKSVKDEDEESDGVPPRPKAKAKAKVKSKAMPRPRGTVRGFFDARRGRRVEVPLRGPNEAPKPRMIRAFSGFSFRPKCRICGNYGHVAAACIQGQRSVSLTTGKIQLSQRIDPKSDEDLRGDALPNYGFENPLSSQISPGDSVSQVGYTPVAPKYALPIPTAPGMSAEERLRLLLKKRKNEEPQRKQGYETTDEPWPQEEENGDLKEELRRKRKRVEMRPFTKEVRDRPSYMRPLAEDPRKSRARPSEAAPKRPPPVPPPKTPPKGPMPPPPKKKAMPVAPKTPPKKPAEKPKTPAKEVAKATSASEAPKSEAAKAPAPAPKAIGIEPPKTPPKMAPKTPSEAFRSVSPTLVDAATPAEPKPSGVERTKDPSPMTHPEGLPEQTVEENVSPKVSPKPPPPPLDSPPTAHQEPPPPPTEIGFPVTGPAEVPKSPMVAPVLPKSSPARPLIDWGAPASVESPIGSTSDITRIMGLASQHTSTPMGQTGSSVASSGTSRPVQCCIACHGTGVLTAEQNVTIFSLLASMPPRSVMLRCSNETLSRVTFECDSAVSVIRESDQLRYPRYTVLEVACGKESVIARSCRDVDYVRYIGIHANLQEIGVRNKMLTLLRDGFSRCPHGSQVACLVHISLPCKGGSPLLNFWGRNEKREKEFFYLLKSSGKYLDEIKSSEGVSVTVSFELPRSNQYWKSRDLQNFFEKRGMAYQSECHACSMGLETQSGLRIGKIFRIQSSNSCLSQRLNSRFQCRCNESHAPFNAVDYHDTERYSMKFARFLVKSFWICASLR